MRIVISLAVALQFCSCQTPVGLVWEPVRLPDLQPAESIVSLSGRWANDLWIQTNNSRLLRYSENKWAVITLGSYKFSSATNDDSVWYISEHGKRMWNLKDGKSELVRDEDTEQVSAKNYTTVAFVGNSVPGQVSVITKEPNTTLEAKYEGIGRKTIDISIGSDGELWAINDWYQLFRLDYDKRAFVRMPGIGFDRIDVYNRKRIVAGNFRGQLYLWDHRVQGWALFNKIKDAIDASVNAGSIYRLTEGGQIYKAHLPDSLLENLFKSEGKNNELKLVL